MIIAAYSHRPAMAHFRREMFAFGSGVAMALDRKREVSFIARELEDNGVNDGSTWSGFDALYKDCLDQIRAETDAGYAALELNLFSTPLTHGFMQGHVIRSELDAHEENWRHSGSISLDSFYRLAEATGARRVLCSEHGQKVITDGDLDAIFDDIETAIGADLTPPRTNGGLFGLKLKRGIFDERHCASIYAAWRLRQIAAERGLKSWRVVEFGGGAGHLAYYATAMGASSYTIVDLPVTSFVQYLMLSEAFGKNQVTLGVDEKARFNLVRPGKIADADAGRFDLAVSMDSMPEFPSATARAYIRIARRIGCFLSLNQETGVPNGAEPQNIVPTLATEAGMKRRYRFPWWMRNGYVEELFES